MKNRFFRGTLAGLMWLACVSMLAQGTVDIFNGPGSEVDAPVYDVDGLTRLAGAAYQAQLFAGPAADQLVAVGDPLPFRSKYGAGYWKSGDTILVINSVPPGAKAFVQIRVWEAAAGTAYEAAMAAGGKRGTSLVLSIVTGGGGAPPSLPPMLVGLESFRLFQGEPPKVVSQPQNQTVIAGNPASFEGRKSPRNQPGSSNQCVDVDRGRCTRCFIGTVGADGGACGSDKLADSWSSRKTLRRAEIFGSASVDWRAYESADGRGGRLFGDTTTARQGKPVLPTVADAVRDRGSCPHAA